MRIKKRNISTALALGLFSIFLLFIGNTSIAQNLDGYIVEGERFDGITIGKSTADSVTAIYGGEYKLIDHKGYSYEMIYKNLGLSFYYCQADPNKEIFVVEIEPPSKVITSKGIILGKSTFDEVFRLYGETTESSMGFEYKGIVFHFEEDVTEEDQEDARNVQKNPDKKVSDKKPENIGFMIDGSRGVESNFVVNELTENHSNQINIRSDRTLILADDSEQKDIEKTKLRSKVVKRIELIENPELRQCDSKFPKR